MSKHARVRYIGKLDDDTIFDQTAEGQTFDFNLGESAVIPGFEEAVASMSVGEKRKITIPANLAYGDHVKELVSEIERSFLPPDLELEEGAWLQMNEPPETFQFKIIKVESDKVTLDANHPLAGKTLHFELELVELS